MEYNHQKKIIGNWGESKARTYLLKNNYYIWYSNWSTKLGEIDIIAIKKRELIFIEVKTRKKNKSYLYQSIDAVDIKKKEKVKQLATAFVKNEIKKIKYSRIKKIRHDIIGISYEKYKKNTNLIHLKDAF